MTDIHPAYYRSLGRLTYDQTTTFEAPTALFAGAFMADTPTADTVTLTATLSLAGSTGGVDTRTPAAGGAPGSGTVDTVAISLPGSQASAPFTGAIGVTDVDSAEPPPNLTFVANFTSQDGAEPGGTLVIDAAGDVFGTANQGGTGYGGTAFEYVPGAGGSTTPLAIANFEAFGATTTGSHPVGGVSTDGAGDLFGTTESGTVFEVINTPGGYDDVPVTLATFAGANGTDPEGGVTIDAKGDLFGTTETGGAYGLGTVFEIPKLSGGYGDLITLVSIGVIGDEPSGRLIIDGQGDLIGASNTGDDVFEVAKSSETTTGYAATATEIASFANGASGYDPTGSLIMDRAGDLFGANHSGGTDNDGTIFEIVRTAHGYDGTPVDLVDFDPGTGYVAGPGADLLMDAVGNLFGTTIAGGAFNHGTLFELQRDTSATTGYASDVVTLSSFDPRTGYAGPSGNLVADASGNLFGTTGETVSVGSFGTVFELTNSGYQPACYVRGTKIATEGCETEVENLAIGDRVLTMRRGLQPIKWIGYRSYQGRFLAGRPLVRPVCIKQSAIGTNVPRRDLWVSPCHAIYLNGVLVPAWLLVNGDTIIQSKTVDSVFYHHIELDAHEIIFAEGCAAETFLDDDSRNQFHNASEFHSLYPADTGDALRYCAPRVESGLALEAIRRRLSLRAARHSDTGRYMHSA